MTAERIEAARSAVRRSDRAALDVEGNAGIASETFYLRIAIRALIQEVEELHGELALFRDP